MKRGIFYFTIIIFMAGLVIAGPVSGKETDDPFRAARQYYERGDYDKAIKAYMDQLAAAVESGPIYYNTANCYLQKGDNIGKAIFFYRMAERLTPRDTSLSVNLKYAKSLMKQADMPFGGSWTLRILSMAFDRLTMKETFILWNACYFGCAVFFVLSLFVKRMKGLLRLAAILLLCMVVTMIVPIRAKIVYEEKTGVIIVPIADARFEPFEDSASKFPLYEGMEVRVLKITKEWYKIKSPDGKIGWLPRKSVWRIAVLPPLLSE